jgi:hypothetical protein
MMAWTQRGSFYLQADDERYTVARYHTHESVTYTAWFKAEARAQPSAVGGRCNSADEAKAAAEAHRAALPPEAA